MTTKKAVWFSRHEPTPAQIEDAATHGYALVAVEDGRRLGRMTLNNDGDTRAVLTALLGLVVEHGADGVYGVAATPVQAQFGRTAEDAVQRGQWDAGDVPFWAAWNVERSAEGGKPTFTHYAWRPVGRISQASLRWLV